MLTKLRLLRLQSKFTLEALATKTGLTRSYLSKVERGLVTPSIGTALKLAKALNLPVENLFGASAASGSITIVRHADKDVPLIPNVNGTAKVVAGTSPGHQVLAFLVYPTTGRVKRNPVSHHDGEELVYVVSGKVCLQLANRKEDLEVGDCAHFDASIPHKITSLGKTRATVLIVIAGESTPS